MKKDFFGHLSTNKTIIVKPRETGKDIAEKDEVLIWRRLC